jgi:hypothetical protein
MVNNYVARSRAVRDSQSVFYASCHMCPDHEKLPSSPMSFYSLRITPEQECRTSLGRVPWGGVGAVGKWPAAATATSLAAAGHLSTAVVIADLR